MKTIEPRAAPLLIPMTPGDAKELFNIDWRRSPDIERLIPTKTAAIILGILI